MRTGQGACLRMRLAVWLRTIVSSGVCLWRRLMTIASALSVAAVSQTPPATSGALAT